MAQRSMSGVNYWATAVNNTSHVEIVPVYIATQTAVSLLALAVSWLALTCSHEMNTSSRYSCSN